MVLLIHIQLGEIWEVKIRRPKTPSQLFLQQYQQWNHSQSLEHLFFFFPFRSGVGLEPALTDSLPFQVKQREQLSSLVSSVDLSLNYSQRPFLEPAPCPFLLFWKHLKSCMTFLSTWLACMLSCFNRVQLCATPLSVACNAP